QYLLDSSSSDRYSSSFIASQIRQPLAFSPDGQFVASWNTNELRLWSTATGEDVRKLKDFHGRLVSAAFSPDGRSMALGILKVEFKRSQFIYSSELQIRELNNGTTTAKFPLTTHVITSTAFAGNGHQVLVSGLHKEGEGSFACLELVDIKDG